MSSVPEPSSQLRYFLAGLKPLGRPLVWIPLGLALLTGLGLWQYRDQLRNLDLSQWNQSNPPKEREWIGGDPVPEAPDPNAIATPTQAIDPITGLPLPARPNNTFQNSNRPNPASVFTPTSPLPSTNPAVPNGNVPDQANRPQLFAPLIPNRPNPNTLLPSPAPSNNSPSIRRPLPTFTITPADPADNPLRQAIENNNTANSAPMPAAPPPTVASPPAGQYRSIYSDSYRPPIYQPYGSPSSNASGGQSPASDNRNPNQPPVPPRPDFNNYGTGDY